jgi:hypothetical protein
MFLSWWLLKHNVEPIAPLGALFYARSWTATYVEAQTSLKVDGERRLGGKGMDKYSSVFNTNQKTPTVICLTPGFLKRVAENMSRVMHSLAPESKVPEAKLMKTSEAIFNLSARARPYLGMNNLLGEREAMKTSFVLFGSRSHNAISIINSQISKYKTEDWKGET